MGIEVTAIVEIGLLIRPLPKITQGRLDKRFFS